MISWSVVTDGSGANPSMGVSSAGCRPTSRQKLYGLASMPFAPHTNGVSPSGVGSAGMPMSPYSTPVGGTSAWPESQSQNCVPWPSSSLGFNSGLSTAAGLRGSTPTLPLDAEPSALGLDNAR